MPVDCKYIANLKGKDYVMLPGLVDLAHQQGLVGVTTDPVLELCDPSRDFYVVRATAIFKGADGEPHPWSAMGDAGPESSSLKGAYLRHAETRAVARALRFATNCAETAYEEMPLGIDEGTRDEERQSGQSNGRDRQQPNACPECGQVINANQRTVSLRRYGRILCPDCQRSGKFPVTTQIG